MSKPNVGDKAPNFEGVNQDGKKLSLDDFKGKKLILYFYPKDMTPGCTAQACNLNENLGELKKEGFEVVGVSADDEKRHKKFREKHDLNFDLIADTEKDIINKYGVWGPKQFMGKKFDGILRTTFIIDEEGKIEHVIDKVKTKTHTEQIKDLVS
ncbi:thioredoxin-dependent thiol peroxidase [Halocola ammonii]